jgi:hypothetical protein
MGINKRAEYEFFSCSSVGAKPHSLDPERDESGRQSTGFKSFSSHNTVDFIPSLITLHACGFVAHLTFTVDDELCAETCVIHSGAV